MATSQWHDGVDVDVTDDRQWAQLLSDPRSLAALRRLDAAVRAERAAPFIGFGCACCGDQGTIGDGGYVACPACGRPHYVE